MPPDNGAPTRSTLGYSLKNIPIPPRDAYMKELIDKTSSVIQRMRWRAHHYLGKGTESDVNHGNEYYGFKTTKSTPHIAELEGFEEELAKVIETVTFRNVRDSFQDTLRRDIKNINHSASVFVQADKTRNLYELSQDEYSKLLTENITKHYKPADENAYDSINLEAREIAEKLKRGLSDRMEPLAKREAYITLKDHKENFQNDLPCRLINPAKSEMGKINKQILENLNNRLREQLDVTTWRNSIEVISWFTSINEKERCTFVNFDIAEFYPSISPTLLDKAIEWATEAVGITKKELEVTQNARKSLLFSKDKAWAKKTNHGLFDVTMGSFDGAEVCELVGMFALAQLPTEYRRSIGLYRDDGLGVLKGLTGSEAERTRKEIIAHFKRLGLRITISTNLRIVNFLDLTLNLKNGSYYPYRKPNDPPLYIHRKSNHPPTIIKSLPAMISRRLTDISHNEKAFDDAAHDYNKALKESGYAENVTYIGRRKESTSTRQTPRRQRRERNITWYNPPFNRSVATKIGERFLKLIDHHFPPGNKLHKIFNRNTVKVSYCCMPNMATLIKRHNARARTRKDTGNDARKTCNCRGGVEACPLNGACLTTCTVYEASVTTAEQTKKYIGSTATTFKERYGNHKASLKNESKQHHTELSKYVWALKRSGTNHAITWKILEQAADYTSISKRCDLCLTEKLLITTADKTTLLNKRSEIASKCRHQRKCHLSNFTPIT